MNKPSHISDLNSIENIRDIVKSQSIKKKILKYNSMREETKII